MGEARAAGRLMEYNDVVKENDQLYREVARRCGLSECAFWILYVLRSSPAALTQSRVCALLCQPKQTVHSALKQLEADGAIRLERGGDRRSKRLVLTPGGLALAEATVDRVIAAEHRAMQALDETEQAEFLRLFHRFTDALNQELGEIT